MHTHSATTTPAAAATAAEYAASTVDSAESENASSLIDSGFSPSFMSSDTGSFAPSNAFVYENGRRYHGYRAGTYLLPNDEREIERLQLYDHIFGLLLGGELHIAPLAKDGAFKGRVLDVGCGAGEWAMNMAELYPEARIIGYDLSRIHPPWVPENCTFEVDDAESEWVWPKEHFDYIHMRCMSGSISDWDLLLSRCFEHIKPGGYVEYQDYGGELFTCGPDRSFIDVSSPIPAPDTPFARWVDIVIDALGRTGRSFRVAKETRARMEKAGFVDVRVEMKAWPVTSWPENPQLDKIGVLGVTGMLESLSSYSMALLTRILGWSTERVEDTIKEVEKDLRCPDHRFWWQTFFIYGRKPEVST